MNTFSLISATRKGITAVQKTNAPAQANLPIDWIPLVKMALKEGAELKKILFQKMKWKREKNFEKEGKICCERR